jgi:hypothetical protein
MIEITECSERLDEVWYIRHLDCPYCNNKVEVDIHEYFNDEGLFQRQVTIKKQKSTEDSESKKKKRKVELLKSMI